MLFLQRDDCLFRLHVTVQIRMFELDFSSFSVFVSDSENVEITVRTNKSIYQHPWRVKEEVRHFGHDDVVVDVQLTGSCWAQGSNVPPPPPLDSSHFTVEGQLVYSAFSLPVACGIYFYIYMYFH